MGPKTNREAAWGVLEGERPPGFDGFFGALGKLLPVVSNLLGVIEEKQLEPIQAGLMAAMAGEGVLQDLDVDETRTLESARRRASNAHISEQQFQLKC